MLDPSNPYGNCTSVIHTPPSIGLVLDAVSPDLIEVNKFDAKKLTQQWLVVNTYAGGKPTIVFVNASSNQALAVGDNWAVITVPLSEVTGPPSWIGHWSLGGEEGPTFPGYRAIRPVYSTQKNLNIPGVGPYAPGTQVTLYGWTSPTQANEVWRFANRDGHS